MSLDFSFTPEQDEIRARVREIGERVVKPNVARWDEKEEMPWEAIAALGEAGLLGVIGRPEYGGLGKDYITLGVVIEELARFDNTVAMICSVQNTLTTLTPGWDEATIRDVYAGRKLVCIATSEEDASYDVSNIQTTATVAGEELVINGRKIHVSLMPGAHVMGVSAQGDERRRRTASISFIRVPSDLPGVSVEIMPEMGMRAHQLAIVDMRDVRVPLANVLQGRDGMQGAGEGKAVMYARWNVTRCLSALNAVGGGLAVLEQTAEFVKKKKVYGKPIGVNQAISFPLIEHMTRLEACRLLAYHGLWINVQGRNAAERAVMSKWFGITEAIQACLACMNMHGAAAGYDRSGDRAAAARSHGAAVHRRDVERDEDDRRRRGAPPRFSWGSNVPVTKARAHFRWRELDAGTTHSIGTDGARPRARARLDRARGQLHDPGRSGQRRGWYILAAGIAQVVHERLSRHRSEGRARRGGRQPGASRRRDRRFWLEPVRPRRCSR